MIDLIFDTETTGKWDFKMPPTAAHQPHLVQLAYVLARGDRVLQSVNMIVVPPVEIPEEAAKIHGITTLDAHTYGLRLQTAVKMFRIAVSRADNVIAHNLDFDERVMFRAQALAGEEEPVAFKNRICTMKAATPICKIPSAYKAGDYKWPTLAEAHKHFLGHDFDDAHDALNDCLAAWRVLRALRAGGHV